jgi:hypothetical protein
VAKTKYGTMDCPTPGCGHTVNVKINENETLSVYCDECEGSDYAKKDQPKHAHWIKVIKPTAAKPADPEPAKKKNVFTP